MFIRGIKMWLGASVACAVIVTVGNSGLPGHNPGKGRAMSGPVVQASGVKAAGGLPALIVPLITPYIVPYVVPVVPVAPIVPLVPLTPAPQFGPVVVTGPIPDGGASSTDIGQMNPDAMLDPAKRPLSSELAGPGKVLKIADARGAELIPTPIAWIAAWLAQVIAPPLVLDPGPNALDPRIIVGDTSTSTSTSASAAEAVHLADIAFDIHR